MIRLNLNASNQVALTLSEAPDGTGTTYLLRFYSTETGEEDTITVTDESLYPDRSQIFTIVMPDDLDLTAGEWHYEAYEDVEGEAGALLEQGIAIVV